MDVTRIGAFLAQLRRENGLTQEELGESLGVSNKTVSRWETGTYLPPVEMLQQLSERYGVSINELLSGERLTEESYREKAEENIKSALSESPFTVEERLAFFKKKWRKDNAFTMVLCALCYLVLLLALKYKGVNLFLIAFTGSLALVALYVVLYNRMMIYAESHVFDKVMKRVKPEWEVGMAEQRHDRWRPRGGFWMAVLLLLGFVGMNFLIVGLTQEPATRLLLDILLRVAFGLMTLWVLVKYYDKGSYREILHTRNVGSALLAGGGILLFLLVEIVILFTRTPRDYWSAWRREIPWNLIVEQLVGQQFTDAFFTELVFALLLEGYFRQGGPSVKRRLLYGLLCSGVYGSLALLGLNQSSPLSMGVFALAMAAVYLHSHNILVPILLHFLQSLMGHLMPYETEMLMVSTPAFSVTFIVLLSVWAVAFLILPEKQYKSLPLGGEGGPLAVDEVEENR